MHGPSGNGPPSIPTRIPERLAQTLRERGAWGDEWLEALPALLDELALAWSLVIGEPYDPGGSTSCTAPVLRTTDQARLVLKVGSRDPESLHDHCFRGSARRGAKRRVRRAGQLAALPVNWLAYSG